MKHLNLTLHFKLTVLGLLLVFCASAQDFNKQLAIARSSYAAGNLENSRFALQQMLNEVDVVIGKEVLKLMPAKLDMLNANTSKDNISIATGFTGVLIHRDYGLGDKAAAVDIISNSPLIASINAILAIPFIGRTSDGNQKVIKINGYKGLLQKNTASETKKISYDLQLPFGSTLLTLKAANIDEAQALKLADAIPVGEIATMLQ